MKRCVILITLFSIVMMLSGCNAAAGAGNDNSGLFPVKEGTKYGFIDRSGKVVIAAQFDRVTDFSEGRAAVQVNKKWGYIDTSGKYVIEPQFDSASVYENGLASVKLGKKTGYIDRGCKFVWSSDPTQALTESLNE